MANAKKLETYRKNCGKTKTFLAKKLGITRPTLYKLMENPEICTFAQVEILSQELNISTRLEQRDIFLP